MKIGISAGWTRALWREKRYLRLKSFGFDCLDYNMADTKTEPYTLDDNGFRAFLENEKRLADNAGMKIWQVHGPWEGDHTDRTPEGLKERMEKMSRSIRGARILGAKYWVIHPIMPHGVQDLDTGRAKDTRAANLNFFRELVKVAKEEDVIICLENMPFPRFSVTTTEDVFEIVAQINDDHFKMCLDTGHANIFKGHSPAQSLRRYGEHIKALHVHDNAGKLDDHKLPFHGTTDWGEFKSALKECGFDGIISLECAPSKALPEHLLEEGFRFYASVAKHLAEL